MLLRTIYGPLGLSSLSLSVLCTWFVGGTGCKSAPDFYSKGTFVIGFESPTQINELLDDTRVALADLAKTGPQTA